MSRTALPAGLRKKLIKLYGQKRGTRVGDPKKIAKMLKSGAKVGDSKQIAKAIAGGTKIPTYAKKGGHVRKKTKKKK